MADDLPPILQTLDSRWSIDRWPTFDHSREQIGVPVPLGLYVVARDDFADVRILSVDQATKTAVEIPYDLVQPVDQTTVRAAAASQSGPVQVAEGTQYELDLGRSPPAVNAIDIDVAPDAHDYHATVQVFGRSGDGQESSLTKSGLLYDTTSSAGATRICRIEFPASHFQHYRVLVQATSDSRLPVAALRAVERVRSQPPRTELPAVKMSWALDAVSRSSSVEADLYFRRLPTNGVKLDVSYPRGDFCRAARVEVADRSDASTNWKTAATFHLYRLTQADGTQVEQSSVEYPSVYGGYVRVIINNGDQPPLTVNDLTAVSITQLLVCDRRQLFEEGRQVALYAGDLQRTSPAARIRAASPDLDARKLSAGITVGERKANPFKLATYDPHVLQSSQSRERTWWLTVGAFLAGVLFAVIVAWRRASA